ncbi:hypothetical protein B0H13DRAFT_2276705 [Mycena leptocephala]|nr:hypothetical protein B0H13DRAFT_2276705 [Mycena leptocephala]
MSALMLLARDGANISPLFGPTWWGFVFNLVTFGMSLLQAWTYVRTSDQDRLYVRISALMMILMDITSTGLVITIISDELINHFGGMDKFTHINPQIAGECYIAMTIAYLAQIYFIHQIYWVKPAGGSRGPIIVLWGIFILATIGWVFGLACATMMMMDPTTPHYNIHFQVVFGGSKGANAVCDFIATAMMVKYLKDTSKDSAIKSTSNLLDAICQLFMNRGLLVALIQVFTFVMYFAFNNTQYWIAPHLVLTKVYVNTFFAILNSRTYLREKYLSGEPATSSGFKTASGLTSAGTKSSNTIAFAAHVSVEVGPRVEKHDRDLDADSI